MTQPQQQQPSRIAACLSSDRMDWETPDELFGELDREFRFTLDAAASPHNTKVPGSYFSEESCGLTQSWEGWRVWCNPPYGRELKKWVVKAAKKEAEIAVLLIPSRTDTAYWHDYIWDNVRHRPRPGVEVRLLRGRVKFKGATSGAPFPSVIVIFHGTKSEVHVSGLPYAVPVTDLWFLNEQGC